MMVKATAFYTDILILITFIYWGKGNAHMWREHGDNNMMDLVLSFHHADSKDQIQGVRVVNKCLYF